eukprot:CAMPEP_0118927060 /NCGR_PEP_ID=MMETSP1169-20130426/4624_1 /TAXON_ID=36882 /ORGANISM="Pyramimonas obovata, Strain CCMP722" /LENGTH=381 /DNA_ID=CAMNT_0006868751 /DNA_START=100 /DNA_END=1245 /DNA_ORIENTATION=-
MHALRSFPLFRLLSHQHSAQRAGLSRPGVSSCVHRQACLGGGSQRNVTRASHARVVSASLAPPTEVLVLSKVEGLAEALTAACGGSAAVTAMDITSPDEQVLREASVIVADPPSFAGVSDQCSSLVWLQSTFAGCDALIKTTTKRDFTCTRLSGVFGPKISEYTMLHILAIERNLKQTWADQDSRVWGRRDGQQSYRTLDQLTLGVLGVGDIGAHVAQTAKAFGMTVWGCRRSEEGAEGVDRMFTTEQLPEFLAGCDYVVNTMPSTALTRGLLDRSKGGAPALAACRGAVLINVGRGDVVEEASVVEALERGWLRHAVLDVFREEPLPQDSPLWTHPAVTVTPHSAAETFRADVVHAFVENLRRYRANEPLRHVLDWERGY